MIVEEKKSTMMHTQVVPDPEVPEKAVRRKYSAEYKSRILKEADACTELGQRGALLRREGLYSSNLTVWRRQATDGLIPKKRGPVAQKPDPRIAALEKENEKLTRKLQQAELIIEVQKKVADLLKCHEERS